MNRANFLGRRSSARSVLSLAVAGLTTTACYHYAPVPVTELAPEMSVRVELSGVGVDRIRRGPDSLARLVKGFKVNGTISRLAADSLLLSVPTSYMEANVRLRTQLHNLALFRSEVQRVHRRQLDKTRTTWAGVALGAATAASIAYVLQRRDQSAGGNPRPPEVPETLIPLGIRD